MYQHILLLLDFDYNNEHLISKIIAMAESSQAKLSFINIDDSNIDYIPYYLDLMHPKSTDEDYKNAANMDLSDFDIMSDENLIHSENMDRLKRAKETLAGFDFPLDSFFIASGDFVKKTQEIAKKHECDLLVMAHHHSHWYHKFMVNHAKDAINHFTTDMLISQE